MTMQRESMQHAVSLPVPVPNNASQARAQQQRRPPRFLLGRILGAGTFSVVKIATHSASGRKVAMKVLSRKKVESLGTAKRVTREIDHLRLCSAHPHITRLYDVVDSPADTILVMEYVSGGDLYDHVKSKAGKRGLPVDEARVYFQQIVSAVEYMHHKRIAHRDLKLENILFDAARRSVKIADFGLSNSVVEGEFMVTPCGSPHYAAPEVITGRPYEGTGADLWSTGVILFGLLCGALPFHETSIPEQFRKIQTGTYTIPKHVSGGAEDLINGLLTVDTAERMTIPTVRQCPWFREQMPPYLEQSPESMEDQERKIVDSDVVDEVVGLYGSRTSLLPLGTEVTRELVEKAIASEESDGSAVEGGGSNNDDEAGRDLRCTYELILDDKHARRRVSEISAVSATSGRRKVGSWFARKRA